MGTASEQGDLFMKTSSEEGAVLMEAIGVEGNVFFGSDSGDSSGAPHKCSEATPSGLDGHYDAQTKEQQQSERRVSPRRPGEEKLPLRLERAHAASMGSRADIANYAVVSEAAD